MVLEWSIPSVRNFVVPARLMKSRRENFLLLASVRVSVRNKSTLAGKRPSPGLMSDLLRRGLRQAELSCSLQAVELPRYGRIQRRAVRLMHRIQECMRMDRPVGRIRDRGANQPYHARAATLGVVEFRRARRSK